MKADADHRKDKKRHATRKRVNEFRKRRRENRRNPIAFYPVPLDGETLNALVRWGWVPDGATGNKKKVGAAIAYGLKEAAFNDPKK